MKKFYAAAIILLTGTAAFAQPSVPSYMIFAGDTIRFDTQDKYERMDRELISFTYAHTGSVLMLKRSDKFFGQIVPILKANGVPEDLKYLMAIESNMNPMAQSPVGAAGLWQFTKSTAQMYGLEVNANVDERYNTEKATAAACDYLLKAYEKYGDWMTVAASYNAGQAGISRRLEDQKQTCAVDLWMPEETSRYIYRLLAVKMLFEKPALFGFIVHERYPYIPPKQCVTTDASDIDLVEFAETYGTTYAELKRANLWLRGKTLDNKGKKSYTIIIPDEGQLQSRKSLEIRY